MGTAKTLPVREFFLGPRTLVASGFRSRSDINPMPNVSDFQKRQIINANVIIRSTSKCSMTVAYESYICPRPSLD